MHYRLTHYWEMGGHMRFNNNKCKVVHMGAKNGKANYRLRGTQIEALEMEKDLEVMVDRRLHSANQCQAAASKASPGMY